MKGLVVGAVALGVMAGVVGYRLHVTGYKLQRTGTRAQGQVAEGGVRRTASWYGKPGDRWSKRFPAAWYQGWPYRVGEYAMQCAYNGAELGETLRVTVWPAGDTTALVRTWDTTPIPKTELGHVPVRGYEPRREIVVVVTDRIGAENDSATRARIDLTWAAFRELADPSRGLVDVMVERIGKAAVEDERRIGWME